ncbi:tRNA (carboxymethyluridine(34)-5-O)-methyltransferase [Saccharomycopsis crataegensis]|uniref:tRNA (Carboxymethyluridine(34)-5-O)-methyltransferase n=1 Tax=Saccharomycopsis crataegensis TaxID=43959 RepID=A0AAV5QG21_9ASCO|nr:tRNA (carboxymethyluridine(34)-5-O)-methyltransferase [Saccharomycopsis crataegensis]
MNSHSEEEQRMISVEDPALREQIYVHTVYNEIAPHFSHTRYKQWPIVEEFLKSRTLGSIGLDVGCGNGKYLGANKNVYIIGSDRSDQLVNLAYTNNSKIQSFSDTLVADGLKLPHFGNSFDFVISIAVIHHFSTPERRIEAIKHIISKLNVGGEALIYVWALEQQNSRRGWKEGMPQDILVPWVLQKNKKKKNRNDEDQEGTQEEEPETKMRYYHLYKKGELEENAEAAGAEVVRNGYERDNWWAVIKRK